MKFQRQARGLLAEEGEDKTFGELFADEFTESGNAVKAESSNAAQVVAPEPSPPPMRHSAKSAVSSQIGPRTSVWTGNVWVCWYVKSNDDDAHRRAIQRSSSSPVSD